MTLTEVAARPLVAAWSAGLPTAWSATDIDEVTRLLVSISTEVTPHIVDVGTLPAADVQEYLLARTLHHVEGWLVRAAAPWRVAYGVDVLRHDPSGAPAVGLASASDAEIDALPGIGPLVAAEIARLITQAPGIDVDDLEWLDDIGPQRVAGLRARAYLDRPVAGLVSPSLLAFCEQPAVPTFLALLHATDLEFFYGDGTTLARRGASGGSAYRRFVDFLGFAHRQARRSKSVAAGVLATEVERWLARHRRRDSYLAAEVAVSGSLLVDDAYVAAAKSLIDAANTRVDVMVFLATTTAGDVLRPGPLVLVESMEAAAARGVRVRAILDQDDGGEPYRSAFINEAIVARFRANGVDVKLDREDVLLHSKVLVVDGESVVVGSHNWTRAAFTATHEVSVLLRGAAVAGQYAARFDALWNTLPALV